MRYRDFQIQGTSPIDVALRMRRPRYTVLLIDGSASMNEGSSKPGKSKRAHTCDAMKKYVEAALKHNPQDRLALILYHSTAHVCCDFLNIHDDHKKLLSAIEKIRNGSSGGTEMKPGLELAAGLFRESKDSGVPASVASLAESRPRLIALSDGYDVDTEGAISVARRIKSSGVLVETLGVAQTPSEVDKKFLKKVATTDEQGTHYRFLGDGALVEEAFVQAAMGNLTF